MDDLTDPHAHIYIGRDGLPYDTLPDTGLDEEDLSTRVTPNDKDRTSERDESGFSMPVGSSNPGDYQEPNTTSTKLRRQLPLANANTSGGVANVLVSNRESVRPGTQDIIERLVIQVPAGSGAISVFRDPSADPMQLVDFSPALGAVPVTVAEYPRGIFLLENDRLTVQVLAVPSGGVVVVIAQIVTVPVIA